jgi:flavin-dependent dehydrogenase
LVIDKAEFPRDKICGDGLTTLTLRLLHKLGLEPESVPSWTPAADVLVRSPRGHETLLPLPDGAGAFAAVARRVDLDMAMVDLVRSEGVEVLDGHGCTGIERAGDHLIVAIDGRDPVRCRFVVAADGMWSPVRKMLGVATPGYLGEWHAFRQYFSGVTNAASTRLHVWFEPDLLPGYAWSFPLTGGRANVGFGILRGGKQTVRDMKALWPDLLSRPHIRAVVGVDAEPESAHRAWPIPARINRARLVSGRTLFVGDAATATDPMTGEGIGQALLTGIRAAESIVAAGTATEVGSRYADEIRTELVADHHMAAGLSRILGYPNGAELALRLIGASGWTRKHFARGLFEDYPRAILLTPKRWQANMFDSPGAYT